MLGTSVALLPTVGVVAPLTTGVVAGLLCAAVDDGAGVEDIALEGVAGFVVVVYWSYIITNSPVEDELMIQDRRR